MPDLCYCHPEIPHHPEYPHPECPLCDEEEEDDYRACFPGLDSNGEQADGQESDGAGRVA
jgi:hypothetical protein